MVTIYPEDVCELNLSFTSFNALRYNICSKNCEFSLKDRELSRAHCGFQKCKKVICMKLEKINDNQIKCILTSEDLAERSIRLSELAYGSEKAQELFRDMMQEAFRQFGFTVDGAPLFVEAVPLNMDSIVLIITKVDDPDELDTRFSKFTMPKEQGSEIKDAQGADDILDAIHKIYEAKKKAGVTRAKAPKETPAEPVQAKPEEKMDFVRCLRFPDMDTVIKAAANIAGFYNGENTLYRQDKTGGYLLVIHKSEHTPEDFNRVVNILSEYGSLTKYQAAVEAYMSEHGQVILKSNAIQKLAELE